MNTKEIKTPVPGSVQIPDLWDIAHLPELRGYSKGGKKAGQLVLETWHLCHKLKESNDRLLEACKRFARFANKTPSAEKFDLFQIQGIVYDINQAIDKAEGK